MKYRILVLKVDPWAHPEMSDDYGKVDCLQTENFKLPPEPLNTLKKVELLVAKEEGGGEIFDLVFQFELSLWAVTVSQQGEPRKILPGGGMDMAKRLMIRNKTMDGSLYLVAHKNDSDDTTIVKVEQEGDEVVLNSVFAPQSSKMIALEIDPEDDEHLYALDDEQKLFHLLIDPDSKLFIDKVYDLSVHKIEDLIGSFHNNCPWDSILVDSRQVTIF